MKSMKTKNKFFILSGIILTVVMALPFFALAQGDPGPGPDAPIDGGLSILLAAGAAYGVKKYRDVTKKKEVEK